MMPQNTFIENECEHLDYKLEYHQNNAKLLHDILCLSNADEKQSKQLIFGVSDNRQRFPGVVGDPYRKTQAMLIDWLRKVNLNYLPNVKLETKTIGNSEFDIIVIENKPYKPYFLTEAYRDGKVTIYPGTVFTRDKDVNTPIDRCASDKQIEKMYLERLGVLDEHSRLIKTVLEESAYNKTPGVGDHNCPFRVEGHLKLLSSPLAKDLPDDIIHLLREVVREGGLCNGGRIGGTVLPGTVKGKSALLYESLSKKN